MERSPERPLATIEQVHQRAVGGEPRYRVMVLLVTFCGLHLGELLALRRDRVDLMHGRINVLEQRSDLPDGTRVFGPPKTAAGVGSISIPPHLIEDVLFHLDTWVAPEDGAFVFSGPKTDGLRRATIDTAWGRARRAVGVEHLHFHDLCHTGNTLCCIHWCEHQGTDGPDGPRQSAGGTNLPTCDRGAGCGDCGRVVSDGA